MTIMTRVVQILRGDFDTDFITMFHWVNWALFVLLVLGALMFFDIRTAYGVFLGSFIATINCMGLHRDCSRLLRMRSMAAYFGGLAVRLGLIVLAVTVIFLFFKQFVSAIGFLIGLSVVIVNFYIWVLGIVIFKALGNKEAV